MKILFVADQIPFPPDNGVRIVSFNAMRLMQEAGHDIAIAVLTGETDQVKERFFKLCGICDVGFSTWMQLPRKSNVRLFFVSLFKNRLIPLERYRSNAFRRKLKFILTDFLPDVIHFDIVTMTQYRDLVPAGVGTVASINDSLALTLENAIATKQYSSLMRILRKFQLFQARNYEKKMYANFGAVHVMTAVDAEYLKKLNPAIHTCVIPNGVHASLFEITKNNALERTGIIFVAKLTGENLFALQEFLKKSWVRVQREIPEAQLYIVGTINAQALAVKNRFSDVPGVQFVGYVEYLEEIYKKCSIAIVPINKNCGLINKAIEAMAAGVVAVGFEKTFLGIKEAQEDVHYIAVTTYEAMGDAIISLIQDRKRRDAIKSAAQSMARRHYSWGGRTDAYENMYKYAIRRAQSV